MAEQVDANRRGPMASLIGVYASRIVTRAQRRLLVVASYLGFGGFVAVRALLGHQETVTVNVVSGATVLVAFMGFLAILHLTHHARTNPPSLLDERQRAVRDHAYLIAYRIMGVLVALGLLYLWVAARTGTLWMPTTSSHYAGLVQVAVWSFVTIPPAVIAWTEPDPPVDDVAEDGIAARAGVAVPSYLLWTLTAATLLAFAAAAGKAAGMIPELTLSSASLLGVGCGIGVGVVALLNVRRLRSQ